MTAGSAVPWVPRATVSTLAEATARRPADRRTRPSPIGAVPRDLRIAGCGCSRRPGGRRSSRRRSGQPPKAPSGGRTRGLERVAATGRRRSSCATAEPFARDRDIRRAALSRRASRRAARRPSRCRSACARCRRTSVTPLPTWKVQSASSAPVGRHCDAPARVLLSPEVVDERFVRRRARRSRRSRGAPRPLRHRSCPPRGCATRPRSHCPRRRPRRAAGGEVDGRRPGRVVAGLNCPPAPGRISPRRTPSWRYTIAAVPPPPTPIRGEESRRCRWSPVSVSSKPLAPAGSRAAADRVDRECRRLQLVPGHGEVALLVDAGPRLLPGLAPVGRGQPEDRAEQVRPDGAGERAHGPSR